VRRRELDPRFHRYLLAAFESRLEADYGVDIVLSVRAVNEMIQPAQAFLDTARHYLQGGESGSTGS
jgi:uncharacterized protein (UPF0332 family)